MKIVSFGMSLDMDFGHPSLLHGLWECLREVFDDYELIHYQFTPIKEKKISDCQWVTKEYSISYKNMLLDFFRWRLHLHCSDEAKAFFNDVKKADIIIDPFGIRFCDNFCSDSATPYNMIRYYCSEYMPFLLTKRLRKRIVKTAASYGPISKASTKKSATFMTTKVYDTLIAREEESKKQLLKQDKINKEILVSPDMANMFAVERNIEKGLVGVSVSFINERYFQGTNNYVQSMVELCKDLIEKYGVHIVLIPNQTLEGKRDDVTIAREIHEGLSQVGMKSEVLEIQDMNSTEIKKKILQCEALIASRYHSCVAALSGGVPLLVLGWHYKYIELLNLYHQDKFIMPTDSFSLESFEKLFNELWTNRNIITSSIVEQGNAIRKKTVDVLRKVLVQNE